MLKYIDVKQNSDEWFGMRAGRLTSSKLGCVMANYGKAFGDPAKKYAIDIAIEQITGEPVSDSFSNGHMQRGTEQEPIAREAYENSTFCDTTNGGFFCNDFLGCSPDFLVDDDGLGEIKCVIPSVHFKNVQRNAVDPSYKWQIWGNLMLTGREWIDYVSYCDDYPEDKKLFIHRVHKDDVSKEFEMMKLRIEEFKALVLESKQAIID